MLDLFGARQQRVEIAISVDEFRCRLHADPGHAGNIIGRIAGKRLDIDDPIRRDAEPFLDFGIGYAALLHRVEHRHAATHKLHQVLVGGDDDGLETGRLGHRHVGGDQVVGLEPRHLDLRQAQRIGGVANQRELRNQLFRRLAAVGLVFGIDVVAEGLARRIKYDRYMARRQIIDELHHHAGEAENRVHRRAVATRHRRQRVEGTEDISRPVDQDELVSVGHERPLAFLRDRSAIIPTLPPHISARAVGADDLAIGAEGQPYTRMAKRAAAAIAGHAVGIDGNGFRFRRASAGVAVDAAFASFGHRHAHYPPERAFPAGTLPVPPRRLKSIASPWRMQLRRRPSAGSRCANRFKPSPSAPILQP